jgi:hypothetical protein
MCVQAVPFSTSSREELLHALDCIQRDFAERVQRVRDRKRVYRRPLIERYLEGQVSIILDFCLSSDRKRDRQSFVHSASRDSLYSLTRLVFQHSVNYSRYASQGDQEFVLVPDVQVVNYAEETIPSFAIWSEVIHNEAEKIRTDGVYLHAPESVFQLVSANVNRETGLLTAGECGSEGGKQRVPSVVDGGFEVVYSIPDYQRKIVERQGVFEIVMKKLIASLRIDFTRNALSFWRTEISDLSVQLRDMFIGSFDLESCCLEYCHTQSNYHAALGEMG